VSIQVYECQDHGQEDVLIRSLDIPPTHDCSECGVPMPNVISAPAIVDVRRTWNDEANYCRVNPYEQAKAQFRNLDRENQERHDARPMEATEAGLQVAAQAIYDQERKPEVSDKQRAQRQFAAIKKKKERTQT